MAKSAVRGGDFLDTRTDPNYPGNWRFHGGVDFLNHAGDTVYAPSTGTVVRTFQPTKPGTMTIEIQNADGYTTQVLYVQPTQAIQDALARKEHIAQKLGLPLTATFVWREKEAAAFPGVTGWFSVPGR